MATLKDVVNFAEGDLGMSHKEVREKIIIAAQRAWYKIIPMHPWQFCRRTKSITTTTTQGALLPADMCKIIDPVVNSGDETYFPTYQQGVEIHNDKYWYFIDDTEVSPLLESATALTITEGATTFTLSSWDADYIGEYVKFGQEPGIYLISDTRTISDIYWGPRISGGPIQIRPRGTMRLSLCDAYKDRVADTVSLHYWVFPPPLYHEWQTIPEYLFEPMKWATISEVKGHTVDKKRGLAIRDYGPQFDQALSMAIVQNPSPRIVETFRDKRGNVRSLGRRG